VSRWQWSSITEDDAFAAAKTSERKTPNELRGSRSMLRPSKPRNIRAGSFDSTTEIERSPDRYGPISGGFTRGTDPVKCIVAADVRIEGWMSFEVGLPSRYQAVRPLGQGGFGDVMLVRDIDRAEDIAMKRLARMDPASIRRFKNEFRVLQGLRHPALARLHELFAVDDAWFLAMEYIAGEDFSAHVRPGGDAKSQATLPELRVSDPGIVLPSATYDEPRLRNALAQLADGVFALHRAGIIHRDIKPPNVLVDHRGRVVILDFGLAAQVEGETHHSADARLVGTPGYMAPEQAQSQPLTRAVDWYAVGVMLFEALTGRRPFIGSLRDIIDAQLGGAPDPAKFGATLPADLHYLCMRLLAPRPEDRPEGAEIIGLLGKPEPIALAASANDFVGRAAELQTIANAVDALTRTGPAVIDVVADSGLGKSALLRRAVERARHTRGAAILSARCYEREAMPYKGVDPLMDELADKLRRRTSEDVLAVMPRDARALCRLFPVLASVEEFARAPELETVENRDTLRSRAIAALRELLSRIADRRPLVVVLDDMQWCCSDSARVLVDLLAEEPPRALFIFAYRPQARQANPALRVLRDGLAGTGIRTSELVLEPLTEGEALQLARAHAPAETPESTLTDIVRDAQGSPMLIEELLRSESGPHGLGLDQMLASRIGSLSEAARTALDLIATAGRLVELRTLRAASGLPAAELSQAIRALEEADVIQRSPAGDDDIALETRHDRVREVAYSALDQSKRAAYHHALGEALVARNGDPEAIAEHFRLAGERDRALPFVRQAAAKAVEALAHDRAIALYRIAVELSSDADRFPVEVALGDTLTFDGQGVAAAEAYRTALAHAPTSTDAVDLRRRVAEQLLRSGRIDEGLDAIEDVMRAANLALPTSSRASLLFQRFRLWTRGLEVPKERKPLTRETRVALDATWSAGVALAGFDLVKSADLQTRHLRMALEAGDPMRMSLGFAMEGVMLALDGAKSQERAALVIEKAEQLAQEIGDPYAMGWASGAASVLAFAEGNLRSAVTLADYAIALFQVRCVDAAWEVGTVQSWFRLRAQLMLGELAAARTEAADVERDAIRRKDLYTQTNVRLGVLPFLRLAANDPAGARSVVAETIAAWSTRGWHNQHQDALRADCMIDLYEGDTMRLRARLDEHNKHLTGTRLAGRVMLHGARAAAAVHDRDFVLARQLAKKIAAEGNAWATAVASGLDARIAVAEGSSDAAARISAGEGAFAAVDMPLHAAALRRLRGETPDADATLASHGIADPARMVDILIC